MTTSLCDDEKSNEKICESLFGTYFTIFFSDLSSQHAILCENFFFAIRREGERENSRLSCEKNYARHFIKIFVSYIFGDSVHRITAWLKKIIIDDHSWDDFVNSRFLCK